MLCKLNCDALSTIFGQQLVLFELHKPRPMRLFEILNAFRGNIDGLTPKTLEQVHQLIQSKKVRQVFVDGSNLGGLVAELKFTWPDIEVITFYHNVETRFFWGAFRSKKSIRALAVLIVNYLAERKATLFSDKRICLSERDSQLLRIIYGEGATHITPMALADKYDEYSQEVQVNESEPFALFVGGSFYANREGISWFVKHVASHIDIKVCVVGKGMEDMRADLEIPGRVVVIGTVDNLADWYRRSRFVIAPIHDGSGMKTKVAEALMFGKKVVGTPEAFAGYEDIVEDAGWLCTNAAEFVSAMYTAQRTINVAFDPLMRDLYERRFSLPAATARLAEVLSVKTVKRH